jgi:hypothetical protein
MSESLERILGRSSAYLIGSFIYARYRVAISISSSLFIILSCRGWALISAKEEKTGGQLYTHLAKGIVVSLRGSPLAVHVIISCVERDKLSTFEAIIAKAPRGHSVINGSW